MVESSAVFIIFQFAEQIGDFMRKLGLGNIMWGLVGIAAVLFVGSFIIPKETKRVQLHWRQIMRRTAAALLVIWIIMTLATYGSDTYSHDKIVWGYPQSVFFMLVGMAALLGLLILVSLIFYMRGDRSDPDPSKLSNKQLSGSLIVMSLVVLAFIGLALISRSVFTTVVVTLFFIFEGISIFYWFYDPVIYVLARLTLRRRKNTPFEPTPGRVNEFAILICAHNEETVIAQSVESLMRLDYPKESYDVIVICDNCTDATAEVARKAGAQAEIRTDAEKAGKGFALEWMFDKLKRERLGKYDAYVILDADNLVNKEFLDAINRKLNQGHEVMQAYLDTKNPHDTWITKSSALAYAISDSVFESAHSVVGLSSQLGGTGMIIRPETLKKIEWRTDSLTEDLVYTTEYVLQTKLPVVWVRSAHVYDEKPLTLQVSLNQRTRWMQGHMAAMFKYAPKCFFEGIKTFSLRRIDVGLYLMKPFMNYLLLLVYITRLAIVFMFPGSDFSVHLLMNTTTATLLVASYALIQLYILRDYNRLRQGLWLPYLWIFTYTWYPPIFRGIVKRKELRWVKTEHPRGIGINDLRKEDSFTVEGDF